MTLEEWRTATITTACIGQLFFVLFYCTLPWWRTFLGRTLFGKAVVFSVLLDTGVAARLWDWPGKHVTIVVLYGCVAVGIWAELIAFIRTSRNHRKEMQ